MLPKLDKENIVKMPPRIYTSSIESRETMEKDIKDYVLNPDVPDFTNPRAVYRATRPFEELKPYVEWVHHINGNHDDNRPKNLKKVTPKQHGEAHAKMRRDRKKPKGGA